MKFCLAVLEEERIKDGRKDGRTNKRTDIRIIIYPRNFVCGGYKILHLQLPSFLIQFGTIFTYFHWLNFKEKNSSTFSLPTEVALASMLFSTNSFTAVARVRTTCPEQILCTDFLSIALISLASNTWSSSL